MTLLAVDRLLSDGYPDDHPVAVAAGRPIPFRLLRTDVARMAARLDGCRQAALVCDDTYRFTVGLLALWQVGADILLPANGQPATLASLEAQATAILNDHALSQAPVARWRFRPLAPDRCRIVFHTSGSTGEPKRVVRTLGMLQREAETLHQRWGATLGAGPVLATVTHQHLYGLTFRLLWPLMAGRPFDSGTDAVWETLVPKLGSGAVIVSSPAHLARLTGLRPVGPDRRPTLIFSAGAPLTAEAARQAETTFGCLPTEIFGSTETGAIATRRQCRGDEAWTLLPANDIRVDADGCMAVRSPYVDGWQPTQDVVDCQPDGFRFVGRADRIVKIEGKRVSLPAVEAALQALPLVVEAAAVVLPGVTPRLAALLVLTGQGRAQLAELGSFRFGRLMRQALSGAFEPAGLPRVWRFADAVPARAMGKRSDAEIVTLFSNPAP